LYYRINSFPFTGSEEDFVVKDPKKGDTLAYNGGGRCLELLSDLKRSETIRSKDLH
jgi:hypothetical protein